jgi:calcineurin-like phosphoesterase family protein
VNKGATIDPADSRDALFNKGSRVKRAVRWTLASLAVVGLSCGGTRTGLTGPSTLPIGNLAEIPFGTDVTPVFPTEIFVGAGDIAQCTDGGVPQATARLLDSIDGTVFALGDNAYPSGTAENYHSCYDTTWGRHKSRTRPVPGNHEYDSASTAAPYFDYFGASAGASGLGFYSYDLGNWHIIALNSNIAVGARSAQAAWLRNDLTVNASRCTLAYWHFPLFSSSKHGNIEQMREFWRILDDFGAEIVLSAHDHVYERFAPQDADGVADPVGGIREFVVGTGGAPPYPFVDVKPNSEVRLSTNGVLRLALKAGGYDWTFIPVSGEGDSGSATCH